MNPIRNFFAVFGFTVSIFFVLGSLGIGHFRAIYSLKPLAIDCQIQPKETQ